MAHTPTGYTLDDYPEPRPIDGAKMHQIRLNLDPVESGMLSEYVEHDDLVEFGRALLEHVDALQAQLDRVDRGLAEALELDEP